MTDPRFGEHLEQLWEAVRRGDPDAGARDPELAETIRRVQALDHVPPPDAVFVKQVRDELLSDVARPFTLDPQVSRTPNGRVLMAPWAAPLVPPRPSLGQRQRWAVTQVATALLVLLTFLAVYVAFGPGRPHPAVFPVVEGTPAATPATGVTTVPLGSGTADALPEDPVWLMTFHSTFRPGGRYGLERSEGPDLTVVTSGTLTYHADQPLTVTRAAVDGAPGGQEVILPGSDAVLRAGDSVLIPMGANVSRRNDDTAPAVEVMTMLEGTFLGTAGRASPSNVVDLPIVTFYISDAHTLPPAPVTIALSRVTLAPGAHFSPPDAPWWMVGTPQEAYPNIEQQPDGGAINTGTDPIELYLTTVEPITGETSTRSPAG